jgi:putative membrane protein
MKRLVLTLVIALHPGKAVAHSGHVHWWEVGTTWTWDPWVIAPLALSLGLYVTGAARLWRRAGRGRGVRPWQIGCFVTGWGLLFGALVAPLHWLGERLFVAHMVEHELLMTLAAPLLAMARPVGAMLWALPQGWRRGLGRFARARPAAVVWRALVEPLVATILHAVAIWAWHVPAFYQAALANDRIHWLQHVSFFITALLFWWALLRGPLRERGYGAAVMYLFATSLHTGLLGVLIALSRRLLYPLQSETAAEWGLSPLEDQQLAGLVMWAPGGLVYAAAALAFAAAWIAAAGRSGARHAAAH